MNSAIYVESVDYEAQGIAHHEGKVLFIPGALPGERVLTRLKRNKPRYAILQLEKILASSPDRVDPPCPYFGVCGGCIFQHAGSRMQLAAKQRVLEDNLWHIAKVRALSILSPVSGPIWGYRYRARLSVQDVPSKGGVLIGFHQRNSHHVADLKSCQVLPSAISSLLIPLRGLIESLSIRQFLPQIELAVGATITVLVLRVLQSPNEADIPLLNRFASQYQVVFWLQTAGVESAVPLAVVASAIPGVLGAKSPHQGAEMETTEPQDLERELYYDLPEFSLKMYFNPTDFTQVNHQVNRVMLKRVMELLEISHGDRVVDLFCGLGNFTLPMARLGASVLGVEGSIGLVGRAEQNAQRNGLSESARFIVANLFTEPRSWISQGPFDKMLIDPPREGAVELVKILSTEPNYRPKRLVYVSCNPASFARDAGTLVHQAGYHLYAVGIADMFPHTAHLESIGLFIQELMA